MHLNVLILKLNFRMFYSPDFHNWTKVQCLKCKFRDPETLFGLRASGTESLAPIT